MMQITDAKYDGSGAIIALVDGAETVIPVDLENRHYAAIIAMVEAGNLAIAPAAPAMKQPPVLSREAFCVALIGAGILTEAEATDAALGTWPPKFEPALAGKTLVEKLTIKNVWRETKFVPRDAALFADLLSFYAAAKGLGQNQAQALGDRIFASALAQTA